jgi:hypothetical protein
MSESPIDPLVPAIADEMADLADRLCRLACILASDSAVLATHFDELQSIDLMVQLQRALADLLRKPGPAMTRIAGIPVEALAMRLAARLDQDEAA